MISCSPASTIDDLYGILKLQQKNLPKHLSAEEINSQGFVTVEHSIDVLTIMNETARHIVARDTTDVVGYVLAMTMDVRQLIPVLEPMFARLHDLDFFGKKITAYPYIMVGQVCIDKMHRGKGVFQACYEAYARQHADQYHFALTEIASSNTRSLRAHIGVGFEVFHSYTDPDGVNWDIVIWDWRKHERI